MPSDIIDQNKTPLKTTPNQVRYNKTLDQTYIIDPKGVATTLDGDQTANPQLKWLNHDEIRGGEHVKNPEESGENIKQMGKDFVVNAASAAPGLLLGPQAALPVRAGLSLLMGFGADRLLNSEKPVSDSAGQALVNTGLGEILPWLAFEKPGINIPGSKRTKISVGSQAPSRTVMAGENVGTTFGRSAGTSASEALGESTGFSRGEMSSASSGSREALSEGTSRGTSKGIADTSSEGTINTKGNKSGVRRTTKEEIAHEPNPAITAMEREVERLENIDTSKYNAGAKKQVQTAIERNKEALDALMEADEHSATVTRYHEENFGEGTSKNKSTSNRSGETEGSSSTRNSGTSKANSSSRSSRESSGTSRNRASGSTNQESSGGSTNKNSGESTTYHGATTNKSVEESQLPGWLGTLIELRKTRLTRNGVPLSPLDRFLSNLGFNTGVDATLNNRK